MASVAASKIQKSFGEWHDRALQAPVEITKYGRTSAFLVSAPLFKAMWTSFRQTLPTTSLSSGELAMILESQIATDRPYDLDDISDLGELPVSGGRKAAP